MATFTWTAQGTDSATTNTTIGATDVLRFSGASFSTYVTVNSYQDSTHVEDSGGTEQCTTHINNCKYVSSGNININGGGSQTLNGTNLTNAKCTLKVNFSDGASVTTTGAIFYAYDGSTTTVAPTGVDFQCAEQGDTAWTNAEGSAAALTINDDTAGTSHDYFIACSATPTSVGEKTAFKLRIELTYS